MDSGCREMLFDLGECVGMDSTFMGVLAGLALRLRHASGALILTRVGPKNRGLLCNLGLDQFLSILPVAAAVAAEAPIPEATPPLAPLDASGADRQSTMRTMVDAHEDLIRMVPANETKFQDVLTYLKEDLRRAQESDGRGS